MSIKLPLPWIEAEIGEHGRSCCSKLLLLQLPGRREQFNKSVVKILYLFAQTQSGKTALNLGNHLVALLVLCHIKQFTNQNVFLSRNSSDKLGAADCAVIGCLCPHVPYKAHSIRAETGPQSGLGNCLKLTHYVHPQRVTQHRC